MPRRITRKPDRYEVWTRVNDEGERVYIGVHLTDDGHIIAASNAYATADEAASAMHLRGDQARWVSVNRDTFEVAGS